MVFLVKNNYCKGTIAPMLLFFFFFHLLLINVHFIRALQNIKSYWGLTPCTYISNTTGCASNHNLEWCIYMNIYLYRVSHPMLRTYTYATFTWCSSACVLFTLQKPYSPVTNQKFTARIRTVEYRKRILYPFWHFCDQIP